MGHAVGAPRKALAHPDLVGQPGRFLASPQTAALLASDSNHSSQSGAVPGAPQATVLGEAAPARRPGRPAKPKLCQCCGVLLTGLQSYFRRYRICPEHRDALTVSLRGQEQRFCQQCGTFHPVTKFAGSRRSCRDRLRKHAIRRRKCSEGGRPASWQWEDGEEGEEEEDALMGMGSEETGSEDTQPTAGVEGSAAPSPQSKRLRLAAQGSSAIVEEQHPPVWLQQQQQLGEQLPEPAPQAPPQAGPPAAAAGVPTSNTADWPWQTAWQFSSPHLVAALPAAAVVPAAGAASAQGTLQQRRLEQLAPPPQPGSRAPQVPSAGDCPLATLVAAAEAEEAAEREAQQEQQPEGGAVQAAALVSSARGGGGLQPTWPAWPVLPPSAPVIGATWLEHARPQQGQLPAALSALGCADLPTVFQPQPAQQAQQAQQLFHHPQQQQQQQQQQVTLEAMVQLLAQSAGAGGGGLFAAAAAAAATAAASAAKVQAPPTAMLHALLGALGPGLRPPLVAALAALQEQQAQRHLTLLQAQKMEVLRALATSPAQASSLTSLLGHLMAQQQQQQQQQQQVPGFSLAPQWQQQQQQQPDAAITLAQPLVVVRSAPTFPWLMQQQQQAGGLPAASVAAAAMPVHPAAPKAGEAAAASGSGVKQEAPLGGAAAAHAYWGGPGVTTAAAPTW